MDKATPQDLFVASGRLEVALLLVPQNGRCSFA